MTVIASQKIFALHLPLQTADVSVAKVLAQLLDLLQLQKMYTQHLYRFDHLKKKNTRRFEITNFRLFRRSIVFFFDFTLNRYPFFSSLGAIFGISCVYRVETFFTGLQGMVFF